MTLNNVLDRISKISLSHKQVRNFYKGLVSDFLNDHTTLYPSVFLQDNGGNISVSRKQTTLSFRMYILDLVHVAADTKMNEYDVLSDMISIAQDLITQISNTAYTDWRISADNAVQFVVENDGDMNAGVVVDITISIQFTQDACAIPSDLIPVTDNSMDKNVYFATYIGQGDEGSTLTPPSEVIGKKIINLIREPNNLHPVSNLPSNEEYTWNGNVIGLGANAPIFPGERFLIIYRRY